MAPPYLLIQATLPTPYTVTSGFWTEQSGRFITHDTFVSARDDLRAYEKDKVSSLVTALSLSLSSATNRVSIIKVERIVYGTMPDGRNLDDLKFSFTGDAYLSSAITNIQVTTSIKNALALTSNIHPKVGHFFSSAAQEKDRLKKFLFLFHVLEINTHQVFASLAENQYFVFPQRLMNSIQQHLEKTQGEAKNLVQRFLWCSILRWALITDSDIDAFKLVKSYRDNLSHGHIIEDAELPIEQVYSLIYKLLPG